MFLETPATRHHLADATLLEELICKLPLGRRIAWYSDAERLGMRPDIADFARWLTTMADVISRVPMEPNRAAISQKAASQPPRKSHVLLNVVDETRALTSCAICSDDHAVEKCSDLVSLAVADRWNVIREKGLCFGCLESDHAVTSCNNKRSCGIDGCSRKHHRLLHEEKKSTRNPFDAQSSKVQQPKRSRSKTSATQALEATGENDAAQTPRQSISNPETVNHCRSEPPFLFKVVPIVLHANGRKVTTYALIDEGSSVSMIDADIASELQWTGPSSPLAVKWFKKGATEAPIVTIEESEAVTITLSGQYDGALHHVLHNVRTVPDIDLPVQSVGMASLESSYPHLRDLPVADYKDAVPKVLIGLEHSHLAVPTDVCSSANHRGVSAIKTALGWVAYGSEWPTAPAHPTVLHIRVPTDDRYAQLDRLIRQHYSTETFGCKTPPEPIESDDVMLAREIMAQTTRRISGRFEVGLLWRSPRTQLPPSYQMALHRLRSVEARMRRDADFGRMYNAQMDALVDKGYARRLDAAEAHSRCPRTWFLPHFAVFNPHKPGKLRLVFDAAATVRDVSLNTELLSGPDTNVALLRLLLQFRVGAVGIVGDIKEMFLQEKMREEDQCAQRYLWRGGDSAAEPDVYAMTVMTFGATCSPALAQHVKNTNAADFADEYPAAANAIQCRHYVDDYVASYDTPEEAADVTNDVILVHRMGGFELRGLKSNSAAALQRLGVVTEFGEHEQGESEPMPSDGETGSGVENIVDLELEAEATEKVLGMIWDTNDDAFKFRTKFARVKTDVLNGSRTPSKRELLSVAMSVFDPYGFLADFLLEPKLLLQELWRENLDWDTPIPERFAKRWHAWRQQIARTELMSVPRCYSLHLSTSADVQLHIFADASEAAFAAVAYWRVKHDDGVDVSFVLGRTRCAPLKVLTVPRLELQAAVLASRLLTEVRASHQMVRISKTVLWSDSATVLSWLRCDQRRYKPFVQFRVAEILEAAPIESWRWVPTLLNVADDATKMNRVTFDPDSRWTRGPAFLRLSETEWPVAERQDAPSDDAAEAEIRRTFVGLISRSRPIFDCGRFSSFTRLCRVAAWVRRFLANSRPTMLRSVTGQPDAKETELAMLMLCRLVQAETFATEMAALRREDAVERSSELYQLGAYIETDGLIRIDGRTDAADDAHLPFETRRPIILPRTHRFTWLMVKEHHERSAHQLTNATIAAIRRRFWVPKIRMLLRSVQSQCAACKLRKAAPIPPVQGQLPTDWLTPFVRPFTNTGLDYFGPVSVTVGRRREKRWVAVFTCLAIRAVHLEIAADLSSDACLVCVRNLCHVRGTPSRIRCDNGTNFVGAKGALTKEEGFLDAAVMQRELGARGIQWLFNCPGNPEAGGVWERMVQGVKRILSVTLREEAPRVETLRAHLLEAANMLNSRPLTHISVSPTDEEALTPNHFLFGGPNAATMTDPADAEPAWVKKQWRICRELSRRFWRQWVKEYLPELTRRSKHHPDRKELAIDDIVIVCDPNQARGRWPLGRVVAVRTGTDGRVRTVEVRTKEGTYWRPVARLAVLDVEPVSDETGGVRVVANAP